MTNLETYIAERWQRPQVVDALRLLGDNEMTRQYFELAWTKQYFDELEAFAEEAAANPRPSRRVYYQIVVEGRGEFPLDMLRFSQCWPITTEDVAGMHPERNDRRKVRLGMIGDRGGIAVNHCLQRFASFLWGGEITFEEDYNVV